MVIGVLGQLQASVHQVAVLELLQSLEIVTIQLLPLEECFVMELLI